MQVKTPIFGKFVYCVIFNAWSRPVELGQNIALFLLKSKLESLIFTIKECFDLDIRTFHFYLWGVRVSTVLDAAEQAIQHLELPIKTWLHIIHLSPTWGKQW